MPFKLFQEPIIPANPAGLTTDELQRYLGVGRNNVTPIAQRLGIEKLHGIYPEAIVWRQLFGMAPGDDAAQAALREPLADINWVSQATGVPQSTIRDHLRSGRLIYDCGVQLGDEKTTPSPRMRRWIPALIRSRRCGSPRPAFTSVAPLPVAPDSNDTPPALPAGSSENRPSEDVFAALLTDPAAVSR